MLVTLIMVTDPCPSIHQVQTTEGIFRPDSAEKSPEVPDFRLYRCLSLVVDVRRLDAEQQ